jgi:hypothetical protein
MFDPLFARAGVLWSAILNFVETAQGSVATSLEHFIARQLIRNPHLDSGQRKLLVHRFAIEGEVDGKTLLDLFLAHQQDLTSTDRQLIQSWQHSFVGLLAIVQVYPNGLEVMNWLTAKHYRIQFSDLAAQTAMSRLKVGDIIIAQISPIVGIDWAILAPWIALGRLGKPKLAVAVGAFRQNYPHYLYCDAPELLAASWESVAVYHDRFVEFFGADEITLTGAQLETRIGEFQTWLVDQQLAIAGIDKSQPISADTEIAVQELQALTETLGLGTDGAIGAEGSTIDRNQTTSVAASIDQMVSPPVTLPSQLRTAVAVTALSHEYWGQMFLIDYPQLKALLASSTPQYLAPDLSFIRKCLADPTMNTFVWRRLAQRFPHQFQIAFSQIYELPSFDLAADLNTVLTKLNKYLEPDLPDLASVPIHLHELFQSAVKEVNKDKTKSKPQPNKGGFGTKS